MKITLMVVGKTTTPEVKTLCEEYFKRTSRYSKFEEVVIDNSSIRLTDPEKIKHKEGESILKKIQPADCVILLDEKGKEHTSESFAAFLESMLLQGQRNLIFLVGGAYGFSPEVYSRANGRICLSRMTFPHQLVRVIFAEQLYRAFTILRGEPYHHT